MKIVISGTYCTGKTTISLALSYLTNIPSTHARTMREILPLTFVGKRLEECDFHEIIELGMRRFTERVIAEKNVGDNFISDGCPLQEWIYGQTRNITGLNPSEKPWKIRMSKLLHSTKWDVFEKTISSFGNVIKEYTKHKYTHIIHLPVEFPFEPDGHRPVSEFFRNESERKLVETYRELSIDTIEVNGAIEQRLEKIVSLLNLPVCMPIKEAIQKAKEERKSSIMKRIVSGIILFTYLSGSLSAQEITGQIIDQNTAETLPFANIIVLNRQDSSIVKGTVTNENGEFSFSSNPEKELVRISYLGYVTKDTFLTEASHIIRLCPDEHILNEIIVKGSRSLYKMENGGITTNIINSPLTNIGTASDVLEKLPFILKSEDNLTVIGKGTPLIYINNRLVRDQEELENLNSADIKEVSIITNPGPQYDAAVSSVIRIKTIRPVGDGLSGSVYSMVSFWKKASVNESVNLNYRTGKLDIFGSFSFSDSQDPSISEMEQSLTTTERNIYLLNYDDQKHHTRGYFVNGGINYNINSDNYIGAKYILNKMSPYTMRSKTESESYIEGIPEDQFISQANWKTIRTQHLLNAYYTGVIAPWLKLQYDMDYAKGNSDVSLISHIDRNRGEEVNTKTNQDYDLYAGKLLLSTPLWENELDYGLEFSHTENKQIYEVNKNEGAEALNSNTNLSKQNLFAAFLSYSYSWEKLNLDLGLRYENVKFEYFENKHLMEEQNRTYRNLFPNVSLSYLGDIINMMISYKTTTQRPSYYDLRNTIQYETPYMYEAGNPYLQPTRINDISYSLLWKDFNIMVSYKIYKDLIFSTIEQYKDQEAMILYSENLKNSQNLTASAYYSPRIKRWQPTLGLTISKDFLTYHERDYNKPYLYIDFQNSFKLPHDYILRIDMWGNTRGNTSHVYLYNTFQADLGLTKTFLKNKLTLNLKATDIFNTNRQKMSLDTGRAYLLTKHDRDTRRIVVSVRYRFNSTSNKYKGRSAANEELQRL